MIKSIFVILVSVLFVIGCSPPQLESTAALDVRKADLLGVWEITYNGKIVGDGRGFGTETITLFSDGRYEQKFSDAKGTVYPKTESTWRLAKNYSGSQVVVLDGLRRYKDGVAAAVSFPPAQSTSLLVETSSSIPFMPSKDVILCVDEADVIFCFKRKSQP